MMCGIITPKVNTESLTHFEGKWHNKSMSDEFAAERIKEFEYRST